MDKQVELLRQQVRAAEFLLRNLKSQLKEAEERAGAQQQPSGNESRLQTSALPSLPPANGGGNVEDGRDSNDLRFDFQPGDIEDEQSEESDAEDAPGHVLPDGQTAIELPLLAVGIVYPNLEDIKLAVKAHAISQGWTCGVAKRDKTRILLRCRTGNDCPFHLRAEQYDHGAKIVSFKGEHNCSFRTDQSHIPRAHAASLGFLREQLPTFMTIDANTTAKEISDAIFQRFGTRVSAKQCRSLRVGPKRKRAPSVLTCGRCGGVGHNRKTCGRRQEPIQTPPE